MAHMKAFGRFMLEAARLSVYRRAFFDDTVFLRAAYLGFLRREPDEDEYQEGLEMLRRKSTSRWNIVRSIIQSSEYRRIYGGPLDALHQARIELVRRCLPPAQTVVDLGGAAPGHPEGALLFMGYPHRPHEVTVIDLPPGPGSGEAQTAAPLQTFVTADGVHVRYLYQSMTDPLPLRDGSVDLVFSGESIEHVTEAEADAVCQQAYRVLRPGGHFCLDTPNAVLTRMQSPEEYIHPEHKVEYCVHELRAKLERRGFEIAEAKGICPMPESIKSGQFDIEELVHNVGLSEEPTEGYLFYFRAVKPVSPSPSHREATRDL